MLGKFNSQGQVFVPSSLPFSVSVWLRGGSYRMTWPHTACWSAPERDATELHLYSLELFTSSPSLGLLDEYQEIGFKYNTVCPGWLPSQPEALAPAELGHQSTHSSTFRSRPCPNHLPTACCQAFWSILHCPPSLPLTFPPLNCSPETLLAS